MASWNPWHGCLKYSAGCLNCYVYRMDERHGRDASRIEKTGAFNLPVRRDRNDRYKLPSGETVYTCFTSDFFLEYADPWRPEAWRMMRERQDLSFFFITKRIVRFYDCIPPDWGNGYPNVTICCTAEDQAAADLRLPVFRDAPIRHKAVILEPLLGPIDLSPYLGDWCGEVLTGGESGPDARICDYAWVMDIRRQCLGKNVPFTFRQTGARLKKDGRVYAVPRKHQHAQAKNAMIDTAQRPL